MAFHFRCGTANARESRNIWVADLEDHNVNTLWCQNIKFYAGALFRNADKGILIRFDLRTALFWVITQRVVVISWRRFEIAYPILNCSLKMGPISCPETSVKIYDYSLCNNPEQRSSLVLFWSLKSHIYSIWLASHFCVFVSTNKHSSFQAITIVYLLWFSHIIRSLLGPPSDWCVQLLWYDKIPWCW